MLCEGCPKTTTEKLKSVDYDMMWIEVCFDRKIEYNYIVIDRINTPFLPKERQYKDSWAKPKRARERAPKLSRFL